MADKKAAGRRKTAGTRGRGRRKRKRAVRRRRTVSPLMRKVRMALSGLAGVMLALTVIYCSNHPEALEDLRGRLPEELTVSWQTEQPGPVTEDGLQVHFIDVGQGDSALIEADGQAMLIDAGENDQGEKVCQYISSQGYDSLSYVVGTHPHSDHIGGIDDVLYTFRVESLLMPDIGQDTATYEDVMEAAQSRNVPVSSPEPGEQFYLGGALITVTGPTENYGDDLNSWSLCLKIQYGENVFLFTGDAEAQAEEDMVQYARLRGISLEADVMKGGHHGSSTSNSEILLEAADPNTVVISCGLDNEYGHPHEEVIERLARMGCVVYRTDHSGTVTAVCDGTEITWETEK